MSRNIRHFSADLGHKFDQKLQNTPDWLRRGIRLSLSVTLFGLLGHSIILPASWGANLQSEVKQVTPMCQSPPAMRCMYRHCCASLFITQSYSSCHAQEVASDVVL